MNILDTIHTKALSTRGVVQNTYDLTIDVVNRRVPGALVECGVFAGSQLGAMWHACQGRRKIYGYDSYEGIPEAGPKDTAQPGIGEKLNGRGRLRSTGISVQTMANVRDNLDAWGCDRRNVHLIKGWFQHTTKRPNPKRIALLRLDGDLYASTITCLRNLYPRLSSGGWLIIDDYGLTGCQRAIDDYFKQVPPLNFVADAHKVAYFQKP